jgi:hypothetical protein
MATLLDQIEAAFLIRMFNDQVKERFELIVLWQYQDYKLTQISVRRLDEEVGSTALLTIDVGLNLGLNEHLLSKKSRDDIRGWFVSNGYEVK